ncbi:MAG TPA: ABC-2 family transporter protein, partial [Chloroflexota bacterium]|nr:ABC-2 family transporter protein [Chloroflexota bacterium]
MSLETSRAARPLPLDVAPPFRLGEFVGLYWRLVGARARSQLQYKTSFYFATVATIFASLVDFAGIAVIFSRVPQLAGWSLGEVALLYGLALTAFGLAETFARGFDLFNRQILTG